MDVYLCFGLNTLLYLIDWTFGECHRAVFVGVLWTSEKLLVFNCEFSQFSYCLFVCWWSDRGIYCISCCNCILKWFLSFK